MDDPLDPKAVPASPEVLRRIETICKRRLHQENDINECTLHVLEGLGENDFRRLRAYEGKSSFKTHLCTLINSFVIDFERQSYGRRRIPKIVSRLGAPGSLPEASAGSGHQWLLGSAPFSKAKEKAWQKPD